MKRVVSFLLAVIGVAVLPFSILAQSITNYAFSYSTGTFTSIVGQTGTQTASLISGSTDDGYYDYAPIGFEFVYMGQIYTQVSASTNGWMTLGQYASSALSNNLTSGTPRPVIAPLWDDLQMANGGVYYRTDGNAPNRVFTIEWNNVRWYYSQTTPTISLQVKLYEGTGVVQFIYRQESGSLGGSESASIGITASGTGSGNFLSVNTTFDAVSSTTETTSINTRPADGYTITFTPPTTTPAAPSNLTFTNVLPAQMTLNWQDNSTNEIGFLIMRSTDGTNYTFVTLTAANTTSFTATGLTPSTTYYWRVYAVNEGRASSPLSGTQATPGGMLSGVRQIPTTNYPN
ncbi:MAG: fibronectin type III domain-containing protein, partial [Bacteroidota bacterium]|nr:fibronectin type III domain-containing protein [Bacteroidota bacterium]